MNVARVYFGEIMVVFTKENVMPQLSRQAILDAVQQSPYEEPAALVAIVVTLPPASLPSSAAAWHNAREEG